MEKVFTLKLNNQGYEKLRQFAFTKKRSMGSVIREALDEKIGKKKDEQTAV